MQEYFTLNEQKKEWYLIIIIFFLIIFTYFFIFNAQSTLQVYITVCDK